MKRRKIEPTFPRIVAACPAAVINPATGKPVDKKRVYDVFRELCYDEESEHPWSHRARFSKTALTETQIERRLACAVALQDLGHTAKWYFEKVVYTDICNTVLPRTEVKAEEQALARKGGKGWGSEDTKLSSSELRGGKESLKLKSTDTENLVGANLGVRQTSCRDLASRFFRRERFRSRGLGAESQGSPKHSLPG